MAVSGISVHICAHTHTPLYNGKIFKHSKYRLYHDNWGRYVSWQRCPDVHNFVPKGEQQSMPEDATVVKIRGRTTATPHT